MYLVTCVHFRSHDKDGSYAIRSAVTENPMLHANTTTICLTERELLSIKVLHCRNTKFQTFWLLWPWPWPDDLYITNLTRNAWRYTASANMNFLQQSFRKLLYDRHTDRYTDTTKIIHHATSPMINMIDTIRGSLSVWSFKVLFGDAYSTQSGVKTTWN